MTAGASRDHRSVLDYDTEDSLVKALEACEIKADTTFSCPVPQDWIIRGVDEDTSRTQSVEEEARRLQILKKYCILDSGREEIFDKLMESARLHFNVPWAGVSIIDMGRRFMKSMMNDDLGLKDKPRKDTFCAHTILQTEGLLVVPDALQDERFCNNPAVVNSPHFRFYAGTSLVSPEGCRLGALCLIDKEPRPNGLTEQEKADLEDFSRRVVSLIVNRSKRLQSGRDHKRTASHEEIEVPLVTSDSEESTKKTASPLRSMDDRRKFLRPVSAPNLLDLTLEIDDNMNPDDCLRKIMSDMYGVKVKSRRALELENFFTAPTEAQMSSYGTDVVAATRSNDVRQLQVFCEERGADSLHCYNRFGEGLLNMACRRGFREMAAFLLNDPVNLPVRIRDDYGRTPIHDACWHPEPQLDIVFWLMQRDPALFWVADKRGFTPFQYARESHWKVWCQFLWDHREHLRVMTRPGLMAIFGEEE